MNNLIRDKNTKQIIKNIVASFGIKGCSMFIALFTTPAYITYFSNDIILGLWFTILSLLAWILNFDMGIGNGLRNKLVKSMAIGDLEEGRKYITSAYIFLSIMACVILIIGSIGLKYVSWNKLLGIEQSVVSETLLLSTLRIIFSSIILQFVLRIIVSIAYALQISFLSGLLNLVTNSTLLIYVSITNCMEYEQSIDRLAIAYLLAVNIPLLVATLFVFQTKFKLLKPKLQCFSYKHAKSILKIGGVFLYLQLVAMFLNNTANLLIANLLGAEQVVEYQLYYKIFHLICTIIAIALAPIWSAITKAEAEKRFIWLRKVLCVMLLIVIVVFPIQFMIVPILQPVFDFWLGENTRDVNYVTASIFAIYGAMFTWSQVCSYISNGLNRVKIQAVCLTIGVGISFSFAYVFSNIWHSYVAITCGMILGFLPYCIIQTIWIINYIHELKKLSDEQHK